MPTKSRFPFQATAVCTLLALACLSIGTDVATAQSFLRRAPAAPVGAAGGNAPATASPAGRPAGGRATTSELPARAAATAAGGRRAIPSTAPAARASAPAVVRADGASARSAASSDGVVQAGRIVATADCRHCGRRGCNACRPGGGRIALACNGRCDAGGCPAHCPVRPEHFGYYPTQWRSWPGQGVRQVAHFDPATTPVVPPRSQLPTLDEEAGAAPEDGAAADEAADDAAAAPAPALRGGDAPADVPDGVPAPAGRAPADEAEDLLPGAGADETMPEGSGAAIRDAAPRDAANVLLSPRRPTPARPASAWRSTSTPRDRRDEEDVPVAAPLDGDGAAATVPVAPTQPSVAETPGNPLRPAEGRAEIDRADRRPRSVAAEGWRPARRGPPGDAAESTLRGVTANPGNPLR